LTFSARSRLVAFTSLVGTVAGGNLVQDGVSMMYSYQVCQPVVATNSMNLKAASGCLVPVGIAHQLGQKAVYDLLPLGPTGKRATSHSNGISASVEDQLPSAAIAAVPRWKAVSG
jgi:hypothetical protein